MPATVKYTFVASPSLPATNRNISICHILYLGRIFIDNEYHKKEYGIRKMELIKNLHPGVKEINLDMPLGNKRTKSLYRKLRYTEIKQEDGFVYYQKKNGEDKSKCLS